MRNLLVVIAIFCFSAVSAQLDQDIFEEVAVTCVASLGMASLLTDVKLSKMVFESDAKWWRTLLTAFVNQQEGDDRVLAEMKGLNAKWDSKELSWDELLDLAQKCSEMKLALEADNE